MQPVAVSSLQKCREGKAVIKTTGLFYTSKGGGRINPYKKLLKVTKAFLKRKATISELRAAVRECEEKAAPTETCDGRHGE
jgi:hypothetical protein